MKLIGSVVLRANRPTTNSKCCNDGPSRNKLNQSNHFWSGFYSQLCWGSSPCASNPQLAGERQTLSKSHTRCLCPSVSYVPLVPLFHISLHLKTATKDFARPWHHKPPVMLTSTAATRTMTGATTTRTLLHNLQGLTK